METHFVTKIFAINEDDKSEDIIDDFLNGLTAEFGSVDIVGYATLMNGVCITVEVELKEEGCGMPL